MQDDDKYICEKVYPFGTEFQFYIDFNMQKQMEFHRGQECGNSTSQVQGGGKL